MSPETALVAVHLFVANYAHGRYCIDPTLVEYSFNMFHLRAKLVPYNDASVCDLNFWIKEDELKVQVAGQKPAGSNGEGFTHTMAEAELKGVKMSPSELAAFIFGLSKGMS